MVSAPVVVMAAFLVMLPEYQLPAAADDVAAIGTDIAKRNGASTRCEDVKIRVPRVMLSLDVVIDRAPLGVMAPKVVCAYQLPMTPSPFGACRGVISSNCAYGDGA